MNTLKSHQNSDNMKGTAINDASILEIVGDLIAALPYGTAILDENRRVLVANAIHLDDGQATTMEEFFGHRTGEPLGCLHARHGKGSCEFDGVCRYCGLPNAIIQSQRVGKKVEQETTVHVPGQSHSIIVDIRLTVQPINISDRQLMLLTVVDISESKRKEILERVFFHDILNKTGSLSGIVRYIGEGCEEEEREDLLQLTGEVLQELNEEIILQKQLLAAESGELIIQPVQVNPHELLDQSVSQITRLYNHGRIERLSPKVRYGGILQTDPVLVKRILINMLKNALEATPDHQLVTAGIQVEEQAVRFWVYNKGLIPPQDQARLFSRNFSTKGANRGLGTYSMKLLGEEYLGGRVFFESHDAGTTFYLELPVSFLP
jgi:signal transduction histidine kinase